MQTKRYRATVTHQVIIDLDDYGQTIEEVRRNALGQLSETLDDEGHSTCIFDAIRDSVENVADEVLRSVEITIVEVVG